MLYAVTFLVFLAVIGLMAIGVLAGRPAARFSCRGAEPCGCRSVNGRKEDE